METEVRGEVEEAAQGYSVEIEQCTIRDDTIQIKVDSYVHEMWGSTLATLVTNYDIGGVTITVSDTGEKVTYTAEEITEAWENFISETQDNLQQMPEADENSTEEMLAQLIVATQETSQGDGNHIIENRIDNDT